MGDSLVEESDRNILGRSLQQTPKKLQRQEKHHGLNDQNEKKKERKGGREKGGETDRDGEREKSLSVQDSLDSGVSGNLCTENPQNQSIVDYLLKESCWAMVLQAAFKFSRTYHKM